tara:strand:- start:6054 stop:6677 length:624 start_codon:yes stop_codon:yes gene_type:complete
MVYNNFLLRLLVSTIFISIYCISIFINFQYVFYLIILIYILIFLEIYNYFKKSKLFPLIYIFISFIFFFSIEFNKENFLYFNLFISTVISFDVFSYIIGKLFGKNQLIKISPNKTYEGLIGGILFSFAISILFSYVFNIQISIKLIIFIFIIIVSAFFGDIIQSFYKRKNNLKNSSEIIPGHGGLFDRFDSFIFSIIFYSISISVLV